MATSQFQGNSHRQFNLILLHINKHLTISEKKDWLFLRRKEIPASHRAECEENFLEFFNLMMRLDIYSEAESHFANLVADLKSLGHINLARVVQKDYDAIKYPVSAGIGSTSPPATSPTATIEVARSGFMPPSLPQESSSLPPYSVQPYPGNQSKLDFSDPPLESNVTGGLMNHPSDESSILRENEVIKMSGQFSTMAIRSTSQPATSPTAPKGVARSGYMQPTLPQESSSLPPYSGVQPYTGYQSKLDFSDHSLEANVTGGPMSSVYCAAVHPADEPSLSGEDAASLLSVPGSLRCPAEEVKSHPEEQPLVQPESANGASQSVRSQPPSPKEAGPAGPVAKTNQQPSEGQLISPSSHQHAVLSQTSSTGSMQGIVHTTTKTGMTFSFETATTTTSYQESQQSTPQMESHKCGKLVCNTGDGSTLDMNDRGQFSPDDSVKDSICDRSNSLEDIADITDTFEEDLKKEKEQKREEEKEQDDEEKEVCEKDEPEEMESEEDVQNMPLEDDRHEKLMPSDEMNVSIPRKAEDSEDMSVLEGSAFPEEEGAWPALAVAKQLSEEKAKKEEEESKIEYDEATGIEKKLYEKMVQHPETLSPQDRDKIQKQMMEHLQKKANVLKKNEQELPFDPDGKLSDYQKELAAPGLMGFNYIICAPIRTGKALSAAAVCNHQRKELAQDPKEKPYKTLFVTPGHCVKERHQLAFQEIFPAGSVAVLDSTAKFREVFNQPSVFVVMLTSSRLSIALDEGDLKFTEVNTMIIDDCHLVRTVHPSLNNVIRHYLTEKKLVLARKAPRGAWTLGKPYGGISYVIGLTPHLGSGESQFSRDNIVRQCGLLDSKGIRRVENVQNLTDLLRINKPPEIDKMVLVAPSKSSVKGNFLAVLEKIMSAIEEKFSIGQEPTGTAAKPKQRPHPPYGSKEYNEWIKPQLTEARRCREEEKFIPAAFLIRLNEVLILNEDLRPKEALDFLRIVQDQLKSDQDLTGRYGKACHKIIDEQQPDLKRMAKEDEAGLTPKLKGLVQKLGVLHKEDPGTKGIVLVRSASIAASLVTIINGSNHTKDIKALHLEDLSHDEDDVGDAEQRMTNQHKVLKQFKDGEAKLLICVDFEQASLDLPVCDYVIRFNVVSDDMGIVQYAGRTKAKENQCFLIAESGSMIADREQQKRDGLRELEKDLRILNEMDPKKWYDVVEDEQLACVRENNKRDFIINYQRYCRRALDYSLLCRQCRKYICNAYYLLKRGVHVSCTDSSIKERLTVAALNPIIQGSDDDTTGVLKCSGQRDGGQSCQNKLGLAVDFKRAEIEEGYGLDARAFNYCYLDGQHAEYIGQDFDSWDEVDFFIQSEDRGGRRGQASGGSRGDDDDDDDDGNGGGGDNRGGRRGCDGSSDGKDSKKGGGMKKEKEGGQTRKDGKGKRSEGEKDGDEKEKGFKKRRSDKGNGAGDGGVDR